MTSRNSPRPAANNQSTQQATTTPTHPFNGHKYISIGQVADFLSCSTSQCRLLAKRGELQTTTTIGGHRRFLASSVVGYAYGESPENTTTPDQTKTQKVIAMCRVSSRKQIESLTNQETVIREHLLEQEKKGGGKVEVEVIKRVSSGLNYECPELLKLVRRMVSGELRGTRLILKDKTRLVRFGWELMSFLAEYGGVTIEYCAEEEQTENESITEDVLSVLTHYTAKVSGNKARKLLKVTLDPDSLQTAFRMKRAGRSYRSIAEHFKQHKITDEKGRTYSENIIRTNLKENWQTLEAMVNGNGKKKAG